jgi:KipI family sensor histidine kinase inhibitor
MRISRAGDRGLLVELRNAAPAEIELVRRALRSFSGVSAVIPGYDSLLVTSDSARLPIAAVAEAADAAIESGLEEPRHRELHRIEVSFASEYAPDLPLLVEKSGLSREALIQRLSELRLSARFLGFTGGFAYLEGLPKEWSLPRRDTPRPRVEAGSLGIAGDLAGFYPAASPGGWNLIGRTDARLWDATAEVPNLITIGDEVAIVPVDRELRPRLASREPERHGWRELATVEDGGQLTLLVGGADPHRCEVGLPAGGPFDRDAAVAANLAVGNDADAAVLECTYVGPTLRFSREAIVSWYGSDVTIRRNGMTVLSTSQFVVSPGDRVSIGPLRPEPRGYLAVHGGWMVDAAPFESQPRRISAGDALWWARHLTRAPRIRLLRSPDAHLLRVSVGPHASTDDQLRHLFSSVWHVTARSDRRGVRLSAHRKPPEAPRMLRSCGMQFGTVQWHPDGDLVVMGPDHPITGGYLQPATLLSSDRWKLAQLVPGDAVRLVRVEVEQREFVRP